MIDEKKLNLNNPDKIEQMRKIVLDAIDDKKKLEVEQVVVKNPMLIPTKKIILEPTNTVKAKKVSTKKEVKKTINILENKMPKAKKPKKVLPTKDLIIKKEVVKNKKSISIEPKITPEISIEKKVKIKDITPKTKESKKIEISEKKEIKPLIIKKPITTVKTKKKYSSITMIILLILLLVVGVGVLFFTPKSENKLSLTLSNYIPFPAMIIDGEHISFKKFIDETNKVQIYLDRQKSRGIINELPPRSEVKENIKRYFTRLHVMNKLAEQYQVSVSKEEIKSEIAKIKSQLRTEDTIEKVLEDVYGWNLADFEDKIIKPYVLGVKISKIIFKDTTDSGELNTKWENLIKQSENEMNIYIFIK